MKGKIVSGFGEGKKFFSLCQYEREFEKILGKKPFFGTLNVDVGEQKTELAQQIKERANLIVPGFEIGEREYFDVRCIRAKLNGISGLLIFPHLNHHPKNILEFVCPQEMRKSFGLGDGHEVEIEI